jgi:hypothetical protein
MVGKPASIESTEPSYNALEVDPDDPAVSRVNRGSQSEPKWRPSWRNVAFGQAATVTW